MNTFQNQSLGIKRLPFTKMLKSEVADYVEKTIDIYDTHDPGSEIITPMFDLLKAKEPEIELLRLSYGIDTDRLRANKFKAEMMLHISALKLKVRMLSKSNQASNLYVVENAINNHLRYLDKCRNDKQLNQKIAGFLDLVKGDQKLIAAIAEFDLQENADAITAAYNKVNGAWKYRVQMLSQRPNVSTTSIIKGMAVAVGNLFKGIEVGHLVNTVSSVDPDTEPGEQTDLTPLISELNQLSEMYYRSITIREANNKRKALLEDEESADDGDTPAGEPAKAPLAGADVNPCLLLPPSDAEGIAGLSPDGIAPAE